MKKNVPSQELVNAILSLKNEEECINFLNDICNMPKAGSLKSSFFLSTVCFLRFICADKYSFALLISHLYSILLYKYTVLC